MRIYHMETRYINPLCCLDFRECCCSRSGISLALSRYTLCYHWRIKNSNSRASWLSKRLCMILRLFVTYWSLDQLTQRSIDTTNRTGVTGNWELATSALTSLRTNISQDTSEARSLITSTTLTRTTNTPFSFATKHVLS